MINDSGAMICYIKSKYRQVQKSAHISE